MTRTFLFHDGSRQFKPRRVYKVPGGIAATTFGCCSSVGRRGVLGKDEVKGPIPFSSSSVGRFNVYQ